MTNEEIKARVDDLLKQINLAESELDKIRESICKHDDTFIGNYSFGYGRVYIGTICSYCGKFLKCLEP